MVSLISSILVYNQRGSITSESLRKLSQTLRLLETIKHQNHQRGDHIIADFPSFLWVLRDFDEDLGLNTSEDYMEQCLMDFCDTKDDGDRTSIGINQNDISGISLEEMEKRVQDKHIIKELFEHRSCLTLPAPFPADSKISNLSEYDEDSLDEEFKQQMRNFL